MEAEADHPPASGDGDPSSPVSESRPAEASVHTGQTNSHVSKTKPGDVAAISDHHSLRHNSLPINLPDEERIENTENAAILTNLPEKQVSQMTVDTQNTDPASNLQDSRRAEEVVSESGANIGDSIETQKPSMAHRPRDNVHPPASHEGSSESKENDDIQIVEALCTSREPGDTTPTLKSEPADVIDLTMDDDDNEQDQFRFSPVNHTSNNPRIKKEAQEDDEDPYASSHPVSHENSMAKYHNLPQLGNTDLLEGGAMQMNIEDFDINDVVTPDKMAEMLREFQQNENELGYDLPVADYDSEEEDIAARKNFAEVKRNFRNRERTLGATMAEKIEFQQAMSQEEKRLRTRLNRQQHESDEVLRAQEDSLFIPERHQSTPVRDADDDSDSGYGPAASSPAPENQTEAQVSNKKPRRGRSKGAKSKPAKEKTAGKSRVTKKQPASNKTAKRGKKKTLPIVDASRLLHHDIIAEANANQGKAAQPGFTSKKKSEALMQLISSIPIEERNLYVGEKVDLDKASKSFTGRGVLKADGNGQWILKGMKSSLHHYQMVGVAWMRDRENATRNPRGGILSDDMGLGKTVSALTNIVDGKAPLNQKTPKATLIVVPSNLINQWFSEVEKHVQVLRKVIVWRAKSKVLDPEAYLSDQDIVITSYHEIVRSLPNKNPPPHIYSAQGRDEWWAKEIEEHKGPLHRVYWHRIVLDEAQAIKNHLSKTSEAICYLKGRFRWCLSGTPIQNALEEFYPYFRFLKCENTGSFELFKRNFAKRGSDKALQRLQVYLGKIMLRRTHLDQMFGRPILQLPPIKPVDTIEVKFNAIERAVYNIVKHRFVMRIKALSKKDNVESGYSQIFTLLLRLRQLVDHPLLIQKTLKELLEAEDLERLWSLTRDKELMDSAPDNRDTANALQVALSTSEQEVRSSGVSSAGRLQAAARDSQLAAKMRSYLDCLRADGRWAEANKRSICCACGSPPTKPYITSCLHIYCQTCLNDLEYGNFNKSQNAASCMECGTSIHKKESYEMLAPDSRSTPEEDIDWYTLAGPILRSAKVKGAVTKIREWFEQDPTNKIIVFTQFRGMIKVMERVCREEKDWGCDSYHGGMNYDARDETIRRFTNDPNCRILLAAMKAGGVGLNLVAANRVILLDLWWNESVEAQAYTRCFRIGQTRDVEVARFVVHDSIDTDILAMQVRKRTEISSAMDVTHRPMLTVRELIELFSEGTSEEETGDKDHEKIQFTGEDEPFIVPDDPYDQIEDDDDDVVMTSHN